MIRTMLHWTWNTIMVTDDSAPNWRRCICGHNDVTTLFIPTWQGLNYSQSSNDYTPIPVIYFMERLFETVLKHDLYGNNFKFQVSMATNLIYFWKKSCFYKSYLLLILWKKYEWDHPLDVNFTRETSKASQAPTETQRQSLIHSLLHEFGPAHLCGI